MFIITTKEDWDKMSQSELLKEKKRFANANCRPNPKWGSEHTEAIKGKYKEIAEHWCEKYGRGANPPADPLASARSARSQAKRRCDAAAYAAADERVKALEAEREAAKAADALAAARALVARADAEAAAAATAKKPRCSPRSK